MFPVCVFTRSWWQHTQKASFIDYVDNVLFCFVFIRITWLKNFHVSFKNCSLKIQIVVLARGPSLIVRNNRKKCCIWGFDLIHNDFDVICTSGNSKRYLCFFQFQFMPVKYKFSWIHDKNMNECVQHINGLMNAYNSFQSRSDREYKWGYRVITEPVHNGGALHMHCFTGSIISARIARCRSRWLPHECKGHVWGAQTRGKETAFSEYKSWKKNKDIKINPKWLQKGGG